MNKLVNEELQAMKYLLGYQRGKVISEQAETPAATTQTPQTVEDVVKQIQTTLNTKYGTKLTVDGKWGNLTQTAFEAAVKSKGGQATPAATTTTPAAASTTTTPAATTTTTTPAATTTTPAAASTTQPQAAPASAETPSDVMGTEVAQPTRRDQRRERQDLRRSNRRAMQDLRAQQRGQ